MARRAAVCPFNIPVVTLGPANDPSGFQWSAPIRPLGDACLSAIEIDPADEQTWYAAGFNGVYQTHDGGLTWKKPLAGHVNSQGLRVVAGAPTLVYAGVGTKLFLSRDKGANWTQIGTHPQPYHPPLYRSLDGGMTWVNVAGSLPWHAVAVQVRPADGFVYALLEGAGVFGSATQGVNWTAPAQSLGLGVSLLMDPLNPDRLYAGRQKVQFLTGGVYHSDDGGNTVQPIGLQGATASDLAFNGPTTRLYAAVYASGIYRAVIPPAFVP